MKKIYLLGLSLSLFSSISLQAADDYITPTIVPEMIVQRMSASGRWLAGQDIYGSLAFGYNTEINRKYEYSAFYTGIGNCISDNGICVGQDIGGIDQHAALMVNSRGGIPAALADIGHSSLDGITPDGTMAVGYMTNPDRGVMFIPFYCSVTITGNTGAPQPLPYPTRNVVGGGEPYVVAATWVSNDGKVAAGHVLTAMGGSYPIVYLQNEAGEWRYQVPSEISSDRTGASFLTNIALSPDGEKLFLCKMSYNEYGEPGNFVPYIYDIEDDKLTRINTKVESLIPIQILPDGSLLAATYEMAFMPYVSYILPPDAEDFIPLVEYMEEAMPEYLPWLEDTLGLEGIIGYDDQGLPEYGFYVITGNVFMSEDMKTIAGGYPRGDFSYVFKEAEPEPEPEPDPTPDPDISGVSAINADNGVYEVYNVAGVKVLSTSDDTQITLLPKGIYIINGKKVKI